MVMKRDEVVPFGRSLDEYRHMFALTEADLDRTIVGVGQFQCENLGAWTLGGLRRPFVRL